MFRPYFVGDNAFAYALCLILWLASPIRSYCADGTANEVFILCISAEHTDAGFLFAQYSLKIVLFLAVLDGIFLVTVLRDLHRKTKIFSEKILEIKRSDLNAFLFVSVCVYGTDLYDDILKLEFRPEWQNFLRTKRTIISSRIRRTFFQENKEFLLSLKESEWRQKHWKKEQLQHRRWYGFEIERLGIPEIPLYERDRIIELRCII